MALVAAAVCFGFASAASARNNALVFRTGTQPGGVVRIVIETSARPQYTITYLHSPARKVIEISNAVAPNMRAGRLTDTFHGHVQDVHMSQANGNVRFEIRLSDYAEARSDFILAPMNDIRNYRLVVDTNRVSEARFATLSGAAPPVAASPPAAVQPAANNNNAPRRRTIVIDPGHGGPDPGAIGVGGTREKDITLAVSLELERILQRNPNYNVIMTRRTDVGLNLRQRSAIAERHNADLFISIHADSSPRRSARGFSVYTLNEVASDEESRLLAERENAADLFGVSGLDQYDAITQSILGDLLQTQLQIASIEFATELVGEVRRRNLILLERPHREAPFRVLRAAVPSVLVEVGFLSNPDDERLMRQPAHQRQIATAIASAIDNVFNRI